jgi:hypothetical protein
MDSNEKSEEAIRAEAPSANGSLGDNAVMDLNNPEDLKGDDALNLKLDKRGLPLVPQPTSHKDDPLVSEESPC